MWEFDFKVSVGIVGFEAAVQQRLAAAGFGGGTNDRAGGFGRRRIQVCSHRKVR